MRAPLRRPAPAPGLPPRRPRAGFTIIEVVLAMGILVLGASAILGMLTFGAALTRTAQLRSAAAAAVEAVNADLDQVLFPYEDGEVGRPVEIAERAVPGAPGVVYSAKAVPNPDDADYVAGGEAREFRVDIEMRWVSGGVQRAKRYSVLRLRQIAFGERLRRDFVEKGERLRPTPSEETER